MEVQQPRTQPLTLTYLQAAELAGLSPRTLRRRVNEGLAPEPSGKTRGKQLFVRSEIVAWIEQGMPPALRIKRRRRSA